MAQSALITKPVDSSDSIDLSFSRSLAQYLSCAGYKVTHEPLGCDVSWAGYDVVYLSGAVVDPRTHSWLLAELAASMSGKYGNQQRWVMDDDEYFVPMSFLRQLGQPDGNEFTHRMRLHGQQADTWPVCEQYSKYRHFESMSVRSAQTVYGDWWTCPDVWRLSRQATDIVLPTSAKYFGHAKSDRAVKLSKCGVQIEWQSCYDSFCKAVANSSASVFLNSRSHAEQVTPRLSESMLLSLCLFHSDCSVAGLEPFWWQVFSDSKSLAKAMQYIHSMSALDRTFWLYRQEEQLMTVLSKRKGIQYADS